MPNVKLLHSFPVGKDRGGFGAGVRLSLDEFREQALIAQDMEEGLPPSQGGARPKTPLDSIRRRPGSSENEHNPTFPEDGEA